MNGPPRRAVGTVGLVALFVALAVQLVVVAGLTAALGAVLVAVGTHRQSRRLLAGGTLLQFGAVLYAGLQSLPAVLVLVALLATILAWDTGEQVITVTEQLPPGAGRVRPLIVHGSASTLVGLVVVGGAYLGWTALSGGLSLIALQLLVIGCGALLLAMRV